MWESKSSPACPTWVLQLIISLQNWPISQLHHWKTDQSAMNQALRTTWLTNNSSLDFGNDLCKDYWNVSHYHCQQSFSGLLSPPEQTTCWLDWKIDEKGLQDYYHVLTGFITGRLSIQEQLILGSNQRLYLKQWQLKVFVSCSNKCEIQQVNNLVK